MYDMVKRSGSDDGPRETLKRKMDLYGRRTPSNRVAIRHPGALHSRTVLGVSLDRLPRRQLYAPSSESAQVVGCT